MYADSAVCLCSALVFRDIGQCCADSHMAKPEDLFNHHPSVFSLSLHCFGRIVANATSYMMKHIVSDMQL